MESESGSGISTCFVQNRDIPIMNKEDREINFLHPLIQIQDVKRSMGSTFEDYKINLLLQPNNITDSSQKIDQTILNDGYKLAEINYRNQED